MAEEKRIVDMREVGASGLRRFSGFVYDEFLPELTGWRGVQTYTEMVKNDATVYSVIHSIRNLCRRVPWFTEAASDTPQDKDAAEFLETCMNDMSQTWIDMVDEVLSMLTFGFSVHEIVYKRRCGDVFDPTMRSKYSDGRIGWRKIPIRSQDSIYRWQFDDHGGIQGVEQLAPPHYYHTTIPVEKILLFRTTTEKNNPEGLSILRGAYRSWYNKKFIENIEGIGVERDLAGLPCAYVPPEILSSGASQDEKNLLASIKNIVVNIRRDAQEGVVFPLAYNVEGKQLFDLKLLSSGGSRQFDTDKIINRYDHRIAMTAMADFLMLGTNQVGSFALASSKTELFATAVGSFLDIVANIFNNYGIPRLFALNDFQISDYPRVAHGDLASADLKEVGEYLKSLAMAGMPLFPSADGKLEKHLMKIAHFPEPVDALADQDMQVNESEIGNKGDLVEIPGLPIQTPTGLSQPADTTPVNGQPPVETVVTNQTGDTERGAFTDNIRDTEEALRNQFKISI